MKSLKLFMLFALCVFAFSCSSDDSDSNNISDQTLQGKVFGENFIAAGGKAFSSGERLSINITNIAADCSSTIFDYDLYISTYITPELGTYNNTNVVLQFSDSNILATSRPE